jgi:hypothetical protein
MQDASTVSSLEVGRENVRDESLVDVRSNWKRRASGEHRGGRRVGCVSAGPTSEGSVRVDVAR